MSESYALQGVLDGMVVLDLTQVLAGPYCTMLLADHGADVIKIEPPGGDVSRGLGMYHVSDTDKRHGGYFHSINRNKRSIVLDLKDARDVETFRAMARTADVVVENYRVGVMERLGLSYESLRAENPRLVYAAVRGFGDPRTGRSPYAEWPAFDIIAQAMGGFMSITGPAPGTHLKSGPGIGDIVPGLMCAFGVVAAVRLAERRGQGQFLDVAMYDAILAICERIVHQHSVSGMVPQAEGNEHPLVNPFSIYPVTDGWVAIGCPIEAQWRALARLIGRDDLLADPALQSNAARVQQRERVRIAIETWTSTRSKVEVAAVLGGHVPCGPVNDVADIFADPHIAAREMLAEVEVAELGLRLQVAGVPIHFADTPGAVRVAGPGLDAHRAEILRQFGL
jgi:crotonobetainyl-CoA:carnitine CoA-transferase CaiB-like acyl-CoA transferase